MTETIEDRIVRAEKANEDGYAAGKAGLRSEPPPDISGPFAVAWRMGWKAGAATFIPPVIEVTL